MTLTKTLQELNWENIRPQVMKVNPELAKIIDQISPNKSFSFIKARYNFGELILKDGLLHLPEKSKSLSAADLKKFQEKLSYSKIPLLLILHNANEVFLDIKSRIIPLNLFKPGSLLGLFESMDYLFNYHSIPKWSVSAGARSLFALPKINESAGFKRLRLHYGLPSNISLRTIHDHWQLFVGMSRHESIEPTWHNEILFFTKEWFVQRNNDPAWVAFQQYLFQHAWRQAQFAIEKIELSLVWEVFINNISSRRLKPTPYLIDHLKHIMLIAFRKRPGFRPAISDLAAPINAMQKAITDAYSFQYAPTIMQTCSLDIENDLPIYYSLAFPTLLEGSSRNQYSSTMMLDLRDIKLLLNILLDSLPKSEFKETQILNAHFQFFHVEKDILGDIDSSRSIIEKDPVLKKNVEDLGGKFCATSPFWRASMLIHPFSRPKN